ncbi:hypothetical protein BDW02DRAFT_128975 [Decorospora gaudefroyi]|uniref:Integral membrane protein-like protein n=1 Tax=Decorospora gaudefroyi TaxID=184978 RepID=A0A6A5KSN8_9PLEO|nr:hypothetical protein BDW02DRAFT_128975 [Decorospora gaudefroyi]
MRLTALIPALCCTAALILSFLCLFAGHKKDFMEDYSLLTLNTSAVGQTLLTPSDDDSLVTDIIDLIPESISSSITETINSEIDELRARLGIEDWYSAHMLNYCAGQYEPEEAANATLSQDDISKNVTGCVGQRAMYKFEPTRIIQDALDKTGVDVTLEDLHWPEDIQDGIDALNALMAAMFVLYVIAICLIFVALVAAIVAVLTSGRLSAFINVLIATLAFLAIGLASALVTAVVVKATDIINDKGEDIGLAASWGGKFLALTWVATALMLIVVLAWIVEFCMGRRRKNRQSYAKHG